MLIGGCPRLNTILACETSTMVPISMLVRARCVSGSVHNEITSLAPRWLVDAEFQCVPVGNCISGLRGPARASCPSQQQQQQLLSSSFEDVKVYDGADHDLDIIRWRDAAAAALSSQVQASDPVMSGPDLHSGLGCAQHSHISPTAASLSMAASTDADPVSDSARMHVLPVHVFSASKPAECSADASIAPLSVLSLMQQSRGPLAVPRAPGAATAADPSVQRDAAQHVHE